MDQRLPLGLDPALPMATPKKRSGGALQDLLAQFGSQKSATSATKARRVESPTNPSQFSRSPTDPKEDSKPIPQAPQQQTYDFTFTDWFANDPATTSYYPTISPQKSQEKVDLDTSEDELAHPDPSPRSFDVEGLKMEKGKRKRGDRPRRSVGQSKILHSDTIVFKQQSKASKNRTSAPKLNTARTRLRNEIAQKSKAKANDFFVANKDYFLPLLPERNYVSKLVAQHDAKPIVPYKELAEQPRGVTATMKPYQLTGLSFLVHLHNNGFSGILGDEMGLGKTLQTLSLFQYLEEYDYDHGVVSEELRPYLVVCPLSVLNSWVSEAQKWVPELKVLRFHGSPNERNHLKRVAMGLEDRYGNETLEAKDRKASRKAGIEVSKLPTEEKFNSYKIIVTTYDTFQAEQSWFRHSFVWRYVALDEGHKIKSNVTQISSALRNITTEYRLILTGTPLQNNLVEMWSLLSWLYPDVFIKNTEVLFKESFDLNHGKVNRQTMDDARRLLELIMLRRMKDSPEVNLGLPPKEEVLLYVPLTPMQRFWYTRLLTRVDNAMLDELFADGKSKERVALANDKQENALLAHMAKLEQESGKQKEWQETASIMRQTIEKEQANSASQSAWRKLMNLVMQLRKCCSHPYLLPDVAPDPYYLGEHIIRASGKFILLEKLLKNSIFAQGKKVLIFSSFTHTLDCCEDLLAMVKSRAQDFKYLRFDGGTGRARRNLDIRLFNDPKSDYKVMLISTRAGGLGINLTTAEDVIFLDEDWNPQITLQAEARAHRIGQTKKVTVYKLCTQGTVEEQMMGRIRKKLYLSAKITESMQSVHGSNASSKKNGRMSIGEDMPQMDTSQLKTLVRRGAQTLSHPDIDVTEMVSWDLETMMQKCRDKPADTQSNTETMATDADEEKWLSVMERVECAVFDGKRYHRQIETKSQTSAANILPESVTREDRRKDKNKTVMIDGFAISKESLDCADWEAVPTFAGKDPRLAEFQRAKRDEIPHEAHCLTCFDTSDSGHLIECKSCPRAYHFDCLDSPYQVKVKGFNGFFCPQHSCEDCGKNTTDAGGLLFRCRWCPHAYCEDCLDWTKAELIGEVPPEFEMMGVSSSSSGFYVVCPSCIDGAAKDGARKAWMENSTSDYQMQHEKWLKEKLPNKEQADGFIPQMDGAYDPVTSDVVNMFASIYDDDISLPALTDVSAFTTEASTSRLSTPNLAGGQQMVTGRKRVDFEMDEETPMIPAEKKLKYDAFF